MRKPAEGWQAVWRVWKPALRLIRLYSGEGGVRIAPEDVSRGLAAVTPAGTRGSPRS